MCDISFFAHIIASVEDQASFPICLANHYFFSPGKCALTPQMDFHGPPHSFYGNAT